MPPHVTAATGLDAFVHAVEAVTGRRCNSLVAAPALHAIRLVLDHLPSAVDDGADLAARQAMQEAALLAGMAIDGGGTGIAHSIGHALGTLAHVPHGVAVAVGLAAALPWNVAGQPDAFDAVARSVGRPAGELADVYAELLAAVRFPAVVQRVGPLHVTAEELAETMVAEENLPMYAQQLPARRRRRTARPRRLDAAAVGAAPRGGMRAITRIEISHHRLPLDPPFPASWDPQPRACSRPRSCACTTTPATSASGPATRCTGSPTTSRTSSVRIRSISNGTPPCCRTSTSTPAGRGRSTWRCGTSPGRSRTGRSGRSSAGAATASAPTRRRVSTVRRRTWSAPPGGPPSSASPR